MERKPVRNGSRKSADQKRQLLRKMAKTASAMRETAEMMRAFAPTLSDVEQCNCLVRCGELEGASSVLLEWVEAIRELPVQ